MKKSSLGDQKPVRLVIDDEIRIHEGEEAAKLLESKTRGTSIDPERGVVQVDLARWQEAQRYERRTWLERGRSLTDDRNEYHRERFANYAILRGRRFAQGIELGCGPFTNMRLVLQECKVERIYLLDPLIRDYLTHSFCKYKNGHFGGIVRHFFDGLLFFPRHPIRFLKSKLNDYRIGGLLGRPVSIEPSTIENYQIDQRFDLVVMINVLEHCLNADAVFGKVRDILLPGGLFVYADKMYNAKDVQRLSSVLYDAGHPLRVDRSIVDILLSQNFEPLMRAEYLVETEFHGLPISYYELYYIGKKLDLTK